VFPEESVKGIYTFPELSVTAPGGNDGLEDGVNDGVLVGILVGVSDPHLLGGVVAPHVPLPPLPPHVVHAPPSKGH
jgi:hypothetical protein